jgi:hypothetical protein
MSPRVGVAVLTLGVLGQAAQFIQSRIGRALALAVVLGVALFAGGATAGK